MREAGTRSDPTVVPETLPAKAARAYVACPGRRRRVNLELETEGMTLNIGPQHPATHGTLRIVAKLDGEQVVSGEPVAGYMHRGYEKLTEVRTYPQITTLVNRIDWLGSFANEVPFILAAEKLMDVEAPPRAQHIRTILFEMSRLANIVLFLGDLGAQMGGVTAGLLRASATASSCSTRSRRSPAVASTRTSTASAASRTTSPKGWIAETKIAMQKVRDVLRRDRGPAHRQRDLPDPLPRRRGHPRRRRPVLRPVRRQPAGQRRRLGPPPRRGRAGPGLRQGRLEGLDPPRRRLLRPLLGAAPGGPRVDQDLRAAARHHPGRADHGQGPPHHQGARGRGLRRDREPARRHGLLRRPRRATSPRSGSRSARRRSTTSPSCRGWRRACTCPTSSPSSPASTSSWGTSTGEPVATILER